MTQTIAIIIPIYVPMIFRCFPYDVPQCCLVPTMKECPEQLHNILYTCMTNQMPPRRAAPEPQIIQNKRRVPITPLVPAILPPPHSSLLCAADPPYLCDRPLCLLAGLVGHGEFGQSPWWPWCSAQSYNHKQNSCSGFAERATFLLQGKCLLHYSHGLTAQIVFASSHD